MEGGCLRSAVVFIFPVLLLKRIKILKGKNIWVGGIPRISLSEEFRNKWVSKIKYFHFKTKAILKQISMSVLFFKGFMKGKIMNWHGLINLLELKFASEVWFLKTKF